jgi:uncharacterized protein (DUF362 family)/ferredoxin
MKPNVSLIACSSYDPANVDAALRRAVDALGGISRFVSPGQRVLLKVNLLRAASPESAIATHPSVVRAAVRLVQEAGAHAVIGDSPGGPFQGAWLRAVYRQTGMVRVAEETGAELNWDFDQRLLPHPEGRMIKGLEVGTFVTDADVVITLPKLKTHSFMQFTGATKILFGAIPGTLKVGYHARFPDPHHFGHMLIDILTLIKPALTIMDGVIAMDGQGPSAGDPFPVGALLAGTDGIALDVVAATLVGMPVRTIYPLLAAYERGLTTGEVSDIDILGDALEGFHIEGFRPPETVAAREGLLHRLGIGKRLSSLFYKQLSPAPSATGRCVGCGVCVRNCPVHAITLIDGHAMMDLKRCIRCYCCHELCPEDAIELNKPWLRRVADPLL